MLVKPALLGPLATIVATLCCAALVLAVPDLRAATEAAVSGDGAELRRQLRDSGVAGVALLYALILVHAVVFYPSEVLNAAAGYAYGFGVAFPLLMGAWLLSGLAAYWVGHAAGRPVLLRLAGEERFRRAEALVHRGGWEGLLAARLIPVVPFSIVGYVAGAARIGVFTYAWTTFLGALPLIAAVTLIGARLQEPSWSDPVLWLALVPPLALAIASRPLLRRMRERE